MRSVFSRGCLALLLAGIGACGDNPVGRQCVGMGASQLVADAAVLRVDVYAGGVGCDGIHATLGSTPLRSQTFTQGQAISLDIPPGQHTVVLTAFSDGGATVEIGGACTDADFQPGAAVCLDLTLAPALDFAVPDLAVPEDLTVCGPRGCCTLDSDCAFLEYCDPSGRCAPGCKSSSDCNAGSDGGVKDGGSATALLCNTEQHTCVQCLTGSDCPVGQLCSPSGACVDGCDLSKGKGCSAGRTCCNNLCLDTSSDAANCGACGRVCNTANVSGAPVCTGGVCTSVCAGTHGNCTRPAAPAADDGCETDLDTSTANCGACGRGCSTMGVATLACSGGKCSSSCTGNLGNCSRPAAPIADDGCESNLDTSTGNCGACGRACSTAGVATLACASGKCTSSCTGSNANCTQPAAPAADNGCETSVSNDVNNCGACGRTCSGANVQAASCSGGKCNSACLGGWGNCTQPAAPAADDGCETNTDNDTSNCGACARTCSSLNVATLMCTGGRCTSTCSAPATFGNCAQPNAPTADDGCESNLTSSTLNCTGCGNACDTATVTGTTTCDGTKCVYAACATGRVNCNQTPPDLNGCECAGNACCAGNTCQLQHSTGLATPATYYHCNPLGTPSTATTMGSGYTIDMALAACAAWIAVNDPTATCGSFGTTTKYVTTNRTKNCPTWCWDDTRAVGSTATSNAIGHVYLDPMCRFLPAPSDPAWN